VRILLAIALVCVGVVSGMFALGALSNLWSGYKDSSTWTYLQIGLPCLALSLARSGSAALRDPGALSPLDFVQRCSAVEMS
jgi:hypothetical protein